MRPWAVVVDRKHELRQSFSEEGPLLARAGQRPAPHHEGVGARLVQLGAEPIVGGEREEEPDEGSGRKQRREADREDEAGGRSEAQGLIDLGESSRHRLDIVGQGSLLAEVPQEGAARREGEHGRMAGKGLGLLVRVEEAAVECSAPQRVGAASHH